MKTGLCILGSTGSIGGSALEVVRNLGPRMRVVGLSAHRRWERLLEQVREFRPRRAVVTEARAWEAFRSALNGEGCRAAGGPEALLELVADDSVDVVLAGISGAAGLPAALAAVEAGKRLALANKEALVMAGAILMPLAARSGAAIVPVDSEHSAVFQAMLAGRREELRRVTLTASGGPFRRTPAAELARVTPEQALRHPTWEMGPLITVNSATLMNKALEVIEACWLFDLAPGQIDVVIHPQSIVHSMVEFHDGSVIAQLGRPDMKVPIQFALTWPARRPLEGAALDLAQLGRLDFERPDLERFPALALARRVIEAGGTAGAVLNAANEEAVARFLEGGLAFPAIAATVEQVLDRHAVTAQPGLDEVLEADRWARRTARELMAAERATSVPT